MARKAAWEDMGDADLGPYGKSRGTRWGRVFTGLLVVAGATFAAAYYLPLYHAHQKLDEQYRELGQRAQGLSGSLSQARVELKAATELRDQLQAEHDAHEGAKKSATDLQERARLALSSKLDKYLKKGNAALLVNAGSVFVGFDSALLFLPQKLEVSPNGRALLCDVVKLSDAKMLTARATLAEGSVIPPVLASSYPNPWALSAGRAAAVAQTLEHVCAFPGAQLSAAGAGNRPARPGLQLTGDPVELEVTFGPR